MSKWKTVKLGDVATYINGFAFKPSDWSETGLPIIRIQNLTNNSSKEINYYDKSYNPKYEVNNGDILISWSASLGVYEWKKGKALLNQHIFKVVFDKLDIDKKFFVYSIQTLLAQMAEETHGATMKHITKPKFDNMPFPLPPLEEQKHIADILDKASNLIGLRKQQLEKMDLLIKSKFIDMFGDYLKQNINPKILPEVAEFIDYRGRTPEKSNKGIPLITAKNVKDNAFSVEPQEFIPEENYEEIMTRGIPKINDVLFTTEAPLGNVCRIPAIFEKFCVGQRLITMQPINGVIASEFLEYVLLSKEFQDEMWKKSSGSTVKGIRSKELAKLTIPIPPIELQNRFADFVEQIEKQKAVMQQSLEKMETNYKALMQEYFG